MIGYSFLVIRNEIGMAVWAKENIGVLTKNESENTENDQFFVNKLGKPNCQGA